MSFRTFYTVVMENREIENVERFKMNNGFIRIHHYPNTSIITNDIINIEPTVTNVIADHVVEIEEHEHRW